MRIWIDLANSPHVPFFRALIPELSARGHDVEITGRDFAETLALAKSAHLDVQVVGAHGGKRLTRKAGNLLARARGLRTWAKPRSFDLALCHNSYSQIVAAKSLRLNSVTLMDYEHQPANHLAFRLAHRIIVPEAFPDAALRKYGAASSKVRRYPGSKEDVYLSEFVADPDFHHQLEALGIKKSDPLVLLRPPAAEALYHRFENELFDQLLRFLASDPSLKVMLLPRNESQRREYSRWTEAGFILPDSPLDGGNLIAASDLMISAGGTMNREAAALGVPVATIYAGRWAAVDEELCRRGRLRRLISSADFKALPLVKKEKIPTKVDVKVRRIVADLICEGW